MTSFPLRLEQVRDDPSRREDLTRRELARAMSAAAAQQERAVAAEQAVERALMALRRQMEGAVALTALRAGHDDLSRSRSRAAHERASVESLARVADALGAELVHTRPR